jgi:copper chaperone CopZ
MRLFILPLAIVSALTLTGCEGTQSTAGRPASGSSNDVAAGAVSENDANVATMWLRGMACPQCSYNVDLQLKKVDGVEEVSVDMLTGKVQARLSPTTPPTREQLTKAIENTTFTLVRLDMPAQPD